MPGLPRSDGGQNLFALGFVRFADGQNLSIARAVCSTIQEKSPDPGAFFSTLGVNQSISTGSGVDTVLRGREKRADNASLSASRPLLRPASLSSA